jgi:hypothetical protein
LAFHSGREADHSPPSSAEVKEWVELTSTPQYAFMAWCSGGAQGQGHVKYEMKDYETSRSGDPVASHSHITVGSSIPTSAKFFLCLTTYHAMKTY